MTAWRLPHRGGAPATPADESAALRAELERAREEAARFRWLFEQHPDATFFLDRDGAFERANAACAALVGVPQGELPGRPFVETVMPEGRAHAGGRLAAALAGAPQQWGVDMQDAAGRRSSARVTLVPTLAGGAVVGVHGVARDVTVERAMEEQLTHQAFHDPLTGLANRALFRERVDRALRRRQDGRGMAVLFVDLDDFKTVNDTLGHSQGDRLLEVVAERLLKATRGYDTVARLGGDEFGVLLCDMARPEDATTVVARITQSLLAPVPLLGKPVRVGASVGLAHADDAVTTDDLLRNADVALYRAKAVGKGGHAVFDPEMRRAALERLALEADLRAAAELGELRLVYQPLVELASGRVVSCEALLRWQHPQRGLVVPNAFIPLAEETGIIVPMGRWVLREACAQLRRWEAALGRAPAIAVNVSARQLDDAAFVGDVAAALADTGADPAMLTLEITESVIMRRPDVTLATLHELKAIGVRLAVDDFGTGYSSLSYLQRFPVDVLKIDKSFVDAVADGGSGAALARTIVAMGEALGLRTVAEGVEREDQRAALAALGCPLGQGYLFARPLDVADMTRRLKDGSRL